MREKQGIGLTPIFLGLAVFGAFLGAMTPLAFLWVLTGLAFAVWCFFLYVFCVEYRDAIINIILIGTIALASFLAPMWLVYNFVYNAFR